MTFTLEMGLLIGLLVVAMVLFSYEWVPSDVVGLTLLLAMVFLGLLPSEEAFAGFGSDTVILILGLLLLTSALIRTGVMDLVGGYILRFTGTRPTRILLVILVAAALLSTFMSNTASTAFFLPVVLGIAAKASISPNRLLLPLAFASILASSITLISTSTNIVVSGVMTQYGLPPMGMFELAPVGIPIAVAGLAYTFLVSRYWLPERQMPGDFTERFGIRPYLTEMLILPESALVGKTLEESGLGRDLDLTVLRIIRNKNEYLFPRRDTVLQERDVLLAEGRSDEILKIKDQAGIDIKADFKLADPEDQKTIADLGLVEVVVLPKSPLLGRTLKNFRFRERYGLQVLGINRRGQHIVRKISQVPLRVGDTLLLQGSKNEIGALAEENVFQIIGEIGQKRPHRKRAPLAIAIFAGALLLGTFKVVSLPVAVITGAVLAFLTRCITPEEAYREVEWKAVILIGSMLALGVAMEKTGTARWIASQIVEFSGHVGPRTILGGFFILTVLLTQPMSNQAAAIVLIPIAIQTALQLELNPRTFAMMIAVAASCSYLTPLEPSCLMVYGPGRYRFSDFLKVGSVLTLLIFALALWLVPLNWPFHAR